MPPPTIYNSLALHPRLPSPVTTRPVPSKLPKLHLKNSSCYVGPLTNLLRQKLCPDRPLGALPSLTYHFDSHLRTGYGIALSPSISLTHRCSFFVWPWGMRRISLLPLSWFSIYNLQPTKSKPAWRYFRISIAE